VHRVFALVLVGIAILVLLSWATSVLPVQSRKKIARTLLVIGIGFVLIMFARAGMPWLAAVGGLALAGLRFVWPIVVRLLPWIVTWKLSQRSKPPSTGGRSLGSDAPEAPLSTRMSRHDALSILGLSEGASDEAIQQAYTILIKKVHPDRGGSAYLAARVNLARDVLLPRAPH
jgi:DnaJ homolog subfamily C member 19